MALRLVRQTSDMPNITNKDDVKMIRYAYGGYNGVIKSFGRECTHTVDGGVFKLLDGRLVLDGWEVDVDGLGQSLDFSTIVGTQYHSIYLEIDAAIEKAEIKSGYLLDRYPAISGFDLTALPNGVGRLLLYNVKVEDGTITEVIKKVDTVPYLTQKVLDLEKRMAELGFKEASVSGGEIVLTDDWTDAVPSYVFGTVSAVSQPYLRVEKIGKLAHIDKLELATHTAATGSGTSSLSVFGKVATLPQIFRPADTVLVNGLITFIRTATGGRTEDTAKALITINTEGEITVSSYQSSPTPVLISSSYPVVLTVLNAGWNIP